MIHVGIDLHQKSSEICFVDSEGVVLDRASIPSRESYFRRLFKDRENLRIVLECSGSSRWVARILRELDHEVLVVNPRRVRLIAESTMKTDRIDAEILAQLSCFGRGLLKSVYQRTEDSSLVRTRLGVRSTLVRTKVAIRNSIRGSLRSCGYQVHGTTLARFVTSFAAAPIPRELRQALDPLLETLVEVCGRLQALTSELKTETEKCPLHQRLQTVPGIGPIVSMAYVSWVDDPNRFSRSRHVGTYAGLRPKVWASGEVERRGNISREGDPEIRRLLVQSAHILIRCKQDSALKQWAEKLASRVGKKKAVVALARKLSILLHHLWITGSSFEPFPTKA